MGHTILSYVLELLEKVRQEEATSVDIETPIGKQIITSIAFTYDNGKKAIAIPTAQSYFTAESEKILWDAIKDTLETVPVIGQNFMFDWGVMWEYGIRDIILDWDTMIAQHLLFTEFPKSLESMVSLYLDRNHHKHMMGEDLYAYNAFDVVTTLEVAKEQKKRMCETDHKVMKQQMLLHKPLLTMEKRGIKVDMSHKEEALAELRLQQADVEKRLNELVGRELNPRSSKQLQAYFYDELGIKPYRDKKTGNLRLDADALERIARKGYKEAELILEARKYGKMSSTYFDMKLDEDNRLRCQIKLTGTVTGRLATAKTMRKTGMNMQNLPPLFGYCLVADDGKIFIEADLSQAEKRLVALIIGDDQDIEYFKAGGDLHKKAVTDAIGGKIEEVTTEQRNKIGKPLNHATSYDVGPNTFAKIIGVDNKRGKQILEAYHKRHPKLKEHFAEIRVELKKSNTLRNLFGRPRRFYGFRDDTLYRSAYDYNPQSTTGDICNNAIIDVYYKGSGNIDLLMQKHDSLFVQVDDNPEAVINACKELKQYMEYTFELNRRSLTVPIEFMIGYRWSKKYSVEFDSIDDAVIKEKYNEVQQYK